MSKKQEYNADNINVLEGLSAIRKRPGMYIGDVGERGLHHCVYEVLDNSTDEAVAGYGKVIKLTKLKNGGIRVEDEGRGIPVEKKENGISAATITLTVLHAGGKFDKDTYKTSGGLHGIGIKATNATSKWLKLTICRNGEQWEQEFEKGVPLYEIKQVGLSKKTGTTLEFIPDDSLFDNIIYDSELLKNRLRNSSFLTKNIEFIYIDEETKEKESFLSLNGLEDMISYQIDPDNILTPVMSFSGSDEKRGFLKDKDTGKEEENGILEKFDLEVSFLYEKGYKTTISSYVNKILTPGGGVHEQGVLDALSAGILKKVKEAKVVSKKDKEIISKVNLDDVKEGLVLAISLSVYTDIIFEGQTKDKLSGVHLRAMIRNLSRDKIETYLNANPVITNKIVQKVITSRKARESAERARKTERKQQSEEIGSMLGKLTDCRSNNPEECELFIVEGQSAGGCVFSETLVKTAFGKDFTIKEIAEKHQNGEEIFIYTYNENTNKIEIQKIANAWKTKTTSDLVKVFLDNGEEIICTPDHPFLLKSGEYISAEKLKDGVSLMSINFYHKVLKVEKYNDTLDVYDIEVPENHNFCLSAGIFIHNSAKQGRDGRYQAILPLKGKPINPLKSVWADVIANEEILSLKTALGCGMGDNIDLSKLRYHKIINQTDADIDGCLRGNTKIKLLDGRIKTIKELAELYPIGGDTFEVWSYDLEKNTPVIGTAHSVRITKKVNNLYEITLHNDFKILSTENHPFLDIYGNYYRADELKIGQQLESLSFTDKNEIIENDFYANSIENIQIIEVENEDVYDITVDKYHNFGIITSKDNQELIFVHNSHIQQLLLTIYNTLFKPVLEAGHIYRAVPPLHRVKIGKEPFYLNNDKDKNDYIKKITEEETKKIKASKKYKELFSIEKEQIDKIDNDLQEIDRLLSLEYSDKLSVDKSNLLNLRNNFKSVIFFNSELKSALSKYVFNRFKGLGEMNPEQLCETTMDPDTRQLIQLKPDKLYDLSDVINTDDFSEQSVGNILSIIERRKEEKLLKREKHPVKDALVDLTIDNIIGLISSEKGKEFRKIYLMRNIIASEIGD